MIASANKNRSLLSEEWRTAIGYDGYEISSYGNVRSSKSGALKDRKICISKDGYEKILLPKNNQAKRKNEFVHVLVLEAFVCKRPHKKETAHLDGNPRNNHVNNLAWVSHKENCQHRAAHGTQSRGETSNFAKLTEKNVVKIIREYGLCPTVENRKIIARKYGIAPYTVYSIACGLRWAHVKERIERENPPKQDEGK